jgi:hypothetical protein
MKYIYALIDPRDGKPRYVGQTNNVVTRYSGHLRDTDHCRTAKADWLFVLRILSVKPIMKVLCTVDDNKATTLEYRWIRKLTKRGYILTNRGHDRRGMKYGDYFGKVHRVVAGSRRWIYPNILQHSPLYSLTSHEWYKLRSDIRLPSIHHVP